MFSEITITCFAASYAVALLLEASRPWFQNALRNWATWLIAAAGLVAHTLFLGNRAWEAGSTPWAGWHEWYLIAAWVLAVAYLYFAIYYRRSIFGLFVLPVVLALIGLAYSLRNEAPFPPSEASQFWGFIHGISLLIGSTVVLIGFLAGIAYLLQASRLKRKVTPSEGLRLPSLESLQRINEHSLVVSAIFLAVGLLSGFALNAILHGRDDQSLAVAWSDPVVWSSGILLVWLLAAGIFSVSYRAARQGRKVAYLTVASLIFLLLALAIVLRVPSTHPSQRGATQGPAQPQTAYISLRGGVR